MGFLGLASQLHQAPRGLRREAQDVHCARAGVKYLYSECVRVWIYMYMYACVYVYMHTYTYTYIYIVCVCVWIYM